MSVIFHTIEGLLYRGEEIPLFMVSKGYRYRITKAEPHHRWTGLRPGSIKRFSFGKSLMRFDNTAYVVEIWEYVG